MKKMNLNFRQFKSPLTLIALLVIFLMTSCQKENTEAFEHIENNTTQESISGEDLTPDGDITKDIEFKQIENGESANSRSAIYLIYSSTSSVRQSNWTNLYFIRPNLPDARVWRVEVEIRPISGNPDLYVYGYDNGSVNPWRYIRGSANAGLDRDKTSFRASGMKASEDRMYVSVYGRTAARYEINIYAITVDCEEYPTANQTVTLEYAPVCGCNGVEYANPGSAWVSGVTSWTNGPCNNIDRLWTNVDANTRGITRMRISNSGQTIRLYGSCSPSDCDWGNEVLTFDGSCYKVTYEHGFATRYIKLHQQPDGSMRMEILNDYHDSRSDRTDLYYFR